MACKIALISVRIEDKSSCHFRLVVEQRLNTVVISIQPMDKEIVMKRVVHQVNVAQDLDCMCDYFRFYLLIDLLFIVVAEQQIIVLVHQVKIQ